jgi:hypothetical protein
MLIESQEEAKTVKRNSMKRNNSQDQVNIQNKDKLLSFSNTKLRI